mmetsp:Transcript_17448/g.27014  ORF Transcript_17448/g.27014 Transcript_17448/m.27014 type:complete len:146 (+) Transcript_17448:249-686(+)
MAGEQSQVLVFVLGLLGVALLAVASLGPGDGRITGVSGAVKGQRRQMLLAQQVGAALPVRLMIPMDPAIGERVDPSSAQGMPSAFEDSYSVQPEHSDFSDFISTPVTKGYDKSTMNMMKLLGKQGLMNIPKGYNGPDYHRKEFAQ